MKIRKFLSTLLACMLLGSLLPSAEAIDCAIYDAYAARAESAMYYLRESEGRVAVYETERARKPLDVTEIELCCLRAADRAMVKAGIPVLSRQELLTLLEDLGS